MVFEFTDDERKAIAKHFGERGKATRQTIRDWIDMQVQTTLRDVVDDATEEAR